MNTKLLLTKCFTLLIRENQIDKINVSNKDFVLNILKNIDIPETQAFTSEHRKLQGIRDLIIQMARTGEDAHFDEVSIMTDLKVVCEDDESLYNTIQEAVSYPYEKDQLNHVVFSLRRDLTNALKEDEIKSILSKASATIKYKQHEIKDMYKFVGGIVSELTPYFESMSEDMRKDPAVTAEVDFISGDGLLDVLREVRDEAKGESIIKTPWQGLNKMTRGGLRRGQTTVVAALQHHGKSLVCLSLCLGACIYNKAEETLTDKEKKALILYISLENEMTLTTANVMMLLKGNLDNEAFGDEDFAKLQVNKGGTEYLARRLNENGYVFKSIRVNPSEWTYLDLFNKINMYEAEGYEIHLCCVDYLCMLPLTGCSGGNDADRYQDLFNRTRNFFAKKKIAFLTPHQLSSEANDLHRMGKKDLAIMVRDGNYYAKSKGIGREVDLELFLYKVNESGTTYMCVARGKHRVSGQTPEEYLDFVLPFADIGGIRWDYGQEDTTLKKVGQKRNASGTIEEPFWD